MPEPQYKWLKDQDKRLRKKPKSHIPNKKANHITLEGSTGTGKTVFIKWLEEYAVDKGYAKIWNINVEEFSVLREILSMGVPYVNLNNPQEKKRVKNLKKYNRKASRDVLPKHYDLKVFIPVTANLPKKLPDFFEPFGIRVNDLQEWTLKIMFGESYEKYSKIYNDKFRGKNTRLNDLMEIGGEEYETDFYTKKSPLGIERVFIREESQSLQYFMRQVNRFKNTVIYTPPEIEDEYSLKPKLREETENQETIAVLYTGHVKDEFLKKFLIAYFIDCMINIQDNLKKQNYRNIFTILESQKIIKKKRDDTATVWDKIITEIFKDSFDDFRRYNIDIWMDSKPNRLPSDIKDNVKRHYLTRVPRGKGLDNILSSYDVDKRSKRNSRGASIGYIFNQDTKYINNYGFVNPDRKIPEFDGTYGYRLPRLLRSSILEPPVSKNDFSWFIELCEGEIDTKEILEEFKEAYEKEEKPFREKIKKIHRKRKEAKKKREEDTKEKRRKKALKLLKKRVKENGGIPEGVPDNWRNYLKPIMEEIEGIDTLRTLENYTREYRERMNKKKREANKTPHEEALEILKENIKGCSTRGEREYELNRLIREGEIQGNWGNSEKEQLIDKAQGDLKREGVYDDKLDPIQ
ncbi:hypothetical protein AKJ56_00415 [candidate division MSBL1 archaeon SCGC-AAA382N08]|uniref:Uncharacterized protein n=1 Tax=candidate division MSBL1 archaeon SCGC-AAA382N08 TaxID=1698285 RepID=A0A133VQN4_9EURY|nr:hypothetical protein AKJ56_00415 [candidate division MSBL1 archaeon SCGC-AAA382N08]